MGKPEKPGELQFYTELLVRTYQDAAALCDHRSSSIRMDIETIRRRSAEEGMSFLTITLPTLGKCLDKALSSDVSFPTGHGFDLSNRAPRHPRFMGAFWKDIFDADGLVADTSHCEAQEAKQCEAVRAVRQVCYLLYKLEGAHPKDSERRKIDDFIATDRLLPEPGEEVPLSAKTTRALESARMVILRILMGFDPLDIIPGHGPGSVATGEKPWEKMNFSRFYVHLDQIYSYPEYFFFNYTHLVDDFDVLGRMEILHEATAKVVLVPKDSRGPRIISMEPLELQWIQQGLNKALTRKLEHPKSLCHGYVNFTYQDVNRDLALDNSYDGSMVTVDMKEASDRVSVWLVEKLFPRHVVKALMSCRSNYTLLPDGHRLRLKKFAPMGSSVCFPVEALTFWALAVGSLIDVLTLSNKLKLPEVYVYGDDLILNKEDLDTIRPVFEELFLEFNEDKCCTGRFFRESCGMDAFKFQAVTPVRVKAPWVERPSPATILAYVSYINSCQHRGYVQTAEYLRAHVDRIPELSVPYTNLCGVNPFAYEMCTWNDARIRETLLSTFKVRYNNALQREEVRIPVTGAHVFMRGKPGWAELFRLRSNVIPPDPFGFGSEPLGPCGYTVPRQTKTRWKWVGINSLLAGIT